MGASGGVSDHRREISYKSQSHNSGSAVTGQSVSLKNTGDLLLIKPTFDFNQTMTVDQTGKN